MKSAELLGWYPVFEARRLSCNRAIDLTVAFYRKFVCLNDNMSSKKSEENVLVKAILLDFYISLFPKPSKFELSQEYRNRFSHLKDLNTWKDYHSMIKHFYIICILLLASIVLYNFCKRRLIRQIKKIIYF